MIIGLCGFARVGKDTIAGRLPYFTRLACADVLKAEADPVLDALGMPADKTTRRPYYVYHGALRRLEDPAYWIRRAAARWNPAVDTVVTDVRYVNEVDWIQAQGGVVFYVSRWGFGPANPEEEKTIHAILDAHNLPFVVNVEGCPEQGAEAVRAFLTKRKPRGIPEAV